MAIRRQAFQGVWNIIRFNWHFYIMAVLALVGLAGLARLVSIPGQILVLLAVAILVPTLISLLVSYYVYDISNLYQFKWTDQLKLKPNSQLANINAGFDETSAFFKERFPHCNLAVYDFYDPKKQTEVSIKRARKAYPPYPGTMNVSTENIPLKENQMDAIFLILSAHEIRNPVDRISFFKLLNKSLAKNGKIVVVEHLRDWPNFLAYTVGFLHFYSGKTWRDTFVQSNFELEKEIKITPFISTYILKSNGDTA